MIKLTKDLYIAKGAERECYVHPSDSSKLVKIEYNNTIDRNQNSLDLYYYTYLLKMKVSFKHIPRCYEIVDTTLGKGLVFDKICNYDETSSKTFEDVVKVGSLTIVQENELLDDLKLYLSSNDIVFGDVVLSNLLCQEIAKDNYRLIIIDGLGARRFGWKLWLQMHSKLFIKLRIEKQWKKLMFNYNELKNI